MVEPSKRSETIEYAIRDIVVEAKKLEQQGRKVLYLNIGDPLKYDFRTPEHILEAAKQGIELGMSYAPSEGIAEAREAIAKDFKQKGMRVAPEDVVIGNGCSEIIWFIIGAVADAKQAILLPKPCYPIYVAASRYLGLEVKFYDLKEELDWQPDVEQIAELIDNKTRAIVLINPNNPTGSVMEKHTIKHIAELAAEKNIVIVADEIYDRLLLDSNKEPKSIGALAKQAPVLALNGLSKNFLATGFRVGWVAPNEALAEGQLIEAIKKLARTRVCAVHPFQYAIKPALQGPMNFLNKFKRKLRNRRDFFIEKIEACEKLSCVKPKAAFYAYVKAKTKEKSDKDFVLKLLREKHVCVVHGSGFGSDASEGYFRIVFLPNEEILNEAFDRISSLLESEV